MIICVKRGDPFSHLSLLTSAGHRSLFEFHRAGWNVTLRSQGQLQADENKELSDAFEELTGHLNQYNHFSW